MKRLTRLASQFTALMASNVIKKEQRSEEGGNKRKKNKKVVIANVYKTKAEPNYIPEFSRWIDDDPIPLRRCKEPEKRVLLR